MRAVKYLAAAAFVAASATAAEAGYVVSFAATSGSELSKADAGYGNILSMSQDATLDRASVFVYHPRPGEGLAGPEGLSGNLKLLIAEWPEFGLPLGPALFEAALPDAVGDADENGWERLTLDIGAALSADKSYLFAVVNAAYDADDNSPMGTLGFGGLPSKGSVPPDAPADVPFAVASNGVSLQESWLEGGPIGKVAASKGGLAWEGDFTAAAPEPGTLALMGIGSVGVGLAVWRKQRRAAKAAT